MFRAYLSLCAALTLSCALAGCAVEDSCTDGDNMSNARLTDGFDPRAPAPELHLLWDQGTGKGAELPSSYFDRAVAPDDGRSRQLVVSAQRVAPREILIHLNAFTLAKHLEGDSELSFSLMFPDRQGIIDCSHPGMADAYFVDIELRFSEGELVSSAVTQRVQLGDI